MSASLSGFCPRACFRRIAPATCANDLPLETAGDRCEPLGSDGVDQTLDARWSDSLDQCAFVSVRTKRARGWVKECGEQLQPAYRGLDRHRETPHLGEAGGVRQGFSDMRWSARPAGETGAAHVRTSRWARLWW
jgi:hypothetical protein